MYPHADPTPGLDPLTGLPGRATLLAWLEGMGPFTLLVIDVDDLEATAAFYGREHAAEVLRFVARLLVSVAGDEALCFRVDASRFAVLLPGSTEVDGAFLVDKLRSYLAMFNDTRELPVSLSVGAATRYGATPAYDVVRAAIAGAEAERSEREATRAPARLKAAVPGVVSLADPI